MGDDSGGSLSDSSSPPDLVPYRGEEVTQYPAQGEGNDGEWNHEENVAEETFEATGTWNTNRVSFKGRLRLLHLCRGGKRGQI